MEETSNPKETNWRRSGMTLEQLFELGDRAPAEISNMG